MRAQRKAETKHQDDEDLDPKDAARGSKQKAAIDRNQPIAERQQWTDERKSADPFHECEATIRPDDFQYAVGALVDFTVAADDVDVFLDGLALERQTLLGMHVVQVERGAFRRT